MGIENENIFSPLLFQLKFIDSLENAVYQRLLPALNVSNSFCSAIAKRSCFLLWGFCALTLH